MRYLLHMLHGVALGGMRLLCEKEDIYLPYDGSSERGEILVKVFTAPAGDS